MAVTMRTEKTTDRREQIKNKAAQAATKALRIYEGESKTEIFNKNDSNGQARSRRFG
jgi:hypothetical protein